MAEKIASLQIEAKLTGTRDLETKLEGIGKGMRLMQDALKGLNPLLEKFDTDMRSVSSTVRDASTALKGLSLDGKTRQFSAFTTKAADLTKVLKELKPEAEAAAIALNAVAGKRQLGLAPAAAGAGTGGSSNSFRGRVGVMGQFGPFAGGAIESVSGGAAMAVAGIAIGATAVKATTDALIEFGGAALQAKMRYDSLMAMLTAGFGSFQQAGKEMEYARSVSDKFGLSLEDTARNYAKFATATQGTKLEGEATKKMFMELAPVLTVLNSRTRDSELIFKAFTDMLSKGKLMSEEVKKQMGNALPGAYRTVAEALGLTTAQLEKQMKAGKRIAEEDVPKITEALSKKFGPAAAQLTDQLAAMSNRMETAGFMAKKALGDILAPGASFAMQGFTKFLKDTEESAKALKGTGFQAFFADIGLGIKGATEELSRLLLGLSKLPQGAKGQREYDPLSPSLAKTITTAPALGSAVWSATGGSVVDFFKGFSSLYQGKGFLDPRKNRIERTQENWTAAEDALSRLYEGQVTYDVKNYAGSNPEILAWIEGNKKKTAMKEKEAEVDEKAAKSANKAREAQLSFIETMIGKYTTLTEGPMEELRRKLDEITAKATTGIRAGAQFAFGNLVAADQMKGLEKTLGMTKIDRNEEQVSSFLQSLGKDFHKPLDEANKVLESLLPKEEKWLDLQTRLASAFTALNIPLEAQGKYIDALNAKNPEEIALSALEKQANKKTASDEWFNAEKAKLDKLKQLGRLEAGAYEEQLEGMKRKHSDVYNSIMGDVENFTKNGTSLLLDYAMMGGSVFKDTFGTSAKDALRNLGAEMLKAMAQAILLKNVIEPLFGGNGKAGLAGNTYDWLSKIGGMLFSPATTGGAGSGLGTAISIGAGAVGPVGLSAPPIQVTTQVNISNTGKVESVSTSGGDEAAMSKLSDRISNIVSYEIADQFRDGGLLAHLKPN